MFHEVISTLARLAALGLVNLGAATSDLVLFRFVALDVGGQLRAGGVRSAGRLPLPFVEVACDLGSVELQRVTGGAVEQRVLWLAS